MKEGLEAVGAIIAIMGAVGGFLLWLVRLLEKKAAEREAARLKAAEMERRMQSFEAMVNHILEEREVYRKETREELQQLKDGVEDLSKDFAQFVRQLFFNQK